MNALRNFVKDESGASAVEYGLLVALIAVVIIGAVTMLGQSVSTMFTGVATTISSVPVLLRKSWFRGRGPRCLLGLPGTVSLGN